MLEQSRPNENVEPSSSGGATRAVDELRSLRDQLARRTRQLEASELRCMEAMEAAQRKSEILALYAHDLRSPLSAIIGYAELLEMGVPETIPDCAVECVTRIREAANNLQTLVDELLARPDITPQLR
jgi:signal transduction histidine kinase